MDHPNRSIRSVIVVAVAATLVLTAHPAFSQDDPASIPTVTIDTPDAESVVDASFAVFGTATAQDGQRIAGVDFRVRGGGKWREASLSSGEEDDEDELQQTVQFSFTVSMRKNNRRSRVQVRAIDTANRESDYDTQQYVRRHLDSADEDFNPEDIPTFTVVSPDAEAVVGKKVTVFGNTNAAADSTVERVQFRLPNQRRWRPATLAANPDGDDNSQAFSFTANLRKNHRRTRIEISAIDDTDRESSTLARQYIRRAIHGLTELPEPPTTDPIPEPPVNPGPGPVPLAFQPESRPTKSDTRPVQQRPVGNTTRPVRRYYK